MDVAVVSVISSGVVAVGSLALQWRKGAEQRRHDATQAFESRAWDLKRDGHLELLKVLNRIRDRADDGYVVASEGQVWLEDFYVAQSPIVAYGTDECRRDLDALMDFVGDLGPLDHKVNSDVLHAIAMSEALQEIFRREEHIPITDALNAKRDAEQRVRDSFTYDEPLLRELVDKLIASTRSSLRGGL